jgi:transposase
MGYIKGSERRQNLLFPSSLDEYIAEDNPVRVIDAFINALDFEELGFERGVPADRGRPGYDPRALLGLYIWGHMNRLRSSRKLERECARNVEAIWLMEDLRPDFKTIADFRKNNGKAISEALVKFRVFCISEGLYGREMVALDGSKFKAVNSRDRNFTREKLENTIKREEERAARYLRELEAADEEDEREEQEEQPKLSAGELREKIARLKQRLSEHKEMKARMEGSGEKQISLTDPDARLMKMSCGGGTQVSYNVQTVVDSLHKLIVEVNVVNDGNDKGQLVDMSGKAKEALFVEELTVVADSGYFEANAIKECEEQGIEVYVPVASGEAKARGIYKLEQFRYESESDRYICPQGESLEWRTTQIRHEKRYKVYGTNACMTCPQKNLCTTSRGVGRLIKRWVHEEVIDRLRERHKRQPEMMKERKKLAEHPFGTMKRAMDQGYFLLRGKAKVKIESNLTVLAYNMKRAINVLGAKHLINSLQGMAI